MRHRNLRTVLWIALTGICVSATPIAHADAAPTITITSPSSGTTVKGKVTVLATAATDPTGTATLVETGISISGAPTNWGGSLDINNSGYNGSSTFGNAGISQYSLSINSSSLSFAFDTTQWPSGSYQVTIYTLDSSGRGAASAPVTIIIPGVASIEFSQFSTVGSALTFSSVVSGADSLSGGVVKLQSSSSPNGPWSDVTSFKGDGLSQQVTVSLPLGTWVHAVLTGSTVLIDSVSRSLQILSTPAVTCSFPANAKYNVLLKGTCVMNSLSDSVNIKIQTNSGNGWTTVSSLKVKGGTFPVSITPKTSGKLQFRISSDGKLNAYAAFNSKVSTMQVSGGPSASKKTSAGGSGSGSSSNSTSSSGGTQGVLSRLNAVGDLYWTTFKNPFPVKSLLAELTADQSSDTGCVVDLFENLATAKAQIWNVLQGGNASWAGLYSLGTDKVSKLGVLLFWGYGSTCQYSVRSTLGMS